MFTGISDELVEFLLGIRFNNNAAFFEQNRKVYEQKVQAPLRALAEDLAPVLHDIDPMFDTRPVRVLSRIRRDTRFSNNKDPYRDHLWLGWRYTTDAREESMGFYWDITPEATHWGCGTYGEHKPLMDFVRARLVAKPNELLAILRDNDVWRRFTLSGNEYKRITIPPEVPEALWPFYRSKGFYFENIARPEDYGLLYSDAIVAQLKEDYARLKPVYRFLRGLESE